MRYSEDYFNWQKDIGVFGGIANLFKFAPFISTQDNVLDFGCGGGFLLDQIECSDKVGVEISDIAREYAKSRGLAVYKHISDVPDEFATVIISNHVLEHVECPLESVKALYSRLALFGKIIFVVPHQSPNEKYRADDKNQHLYTWNPQTLGNLFKAAGYQNIFVDVIRHKWPPNYARLHALLGQRGFDWVCRAYAIYKHNYQIRIIAERLPK